LIEIINKQLLLQLVGYLCYWQMGFNSVFKGLMKLKKCPYEQTCFLFMPVFLSSSSSTIDCRETDIKMACSLDIVIHCSLSFDMRYSNDSSS